MITSHVSLNTCWVIFCQVKPNSAGAGASTTVCAADTGGTAGAAGAAGSFFDPETQDLDDAMTVFVTSGGACRRLVSEAAAAQTCSIGLLYADALTGTQMYSTCRPLTKLQEQKIKKVKGEPTSMSISHILFRTRLGCSPRTQAKPLAVAVAVAVAF